MIEVLLLAARTDFLQDMNLPAAIGGAVILLLLNQLLGNWGYKLF
jgi:hypothetical protein